MQRDRVAFFAVGGVLVDPDRRRVDHLDIAVIGFGNSRQKAIPHPRPSPSVEAVHAGRVRTVAIGNVRPGRSRPQPPEDPVQNPTVVDARHPTRLVGQQRRNHRPFEIRQIETSHSSLHRWKIESPIP
jgi:hypothetical protein